MVIHEAGAVKALNAAYKKGYEIAPMKDGRIGIYTEYWALKKMRHGFAVRRRGWNGKGIFIKMQVPDEHSKMTSPYIYIDTTGLQTDNAFAPRSCVPWLASQTDMLAEDWEVAE